MAEAYWLIKVLNRYSPDRESEMNTKVGGRVLFTFLLALMFIVTACGTLEVGVEPADFMDDPVNTATQTTQAALVTAEVDAEVTAVATPEETR
jgi:hypothetical protein